MEMKRLSKERYYLDIAFTVSKRSTCLRRHIGAIIVKNDSIISTGYNGSARGTPNCFEKGCMKNKLGLPYGSSYDSCRAGILHAEVNAIINAARNNGGTNGATIYVAGGYVDGKGNLGAAICKHCQKAIINAGIKRAIMAVENGFKEFLVEDWVKESKKTKTRDLAGLY